MLRIGIVVGEPSGDELAAGLIDAIKERRRDVIIEGILGPRLLQRGGHAYFPMSKLSVMGITEIISAYPELASIRNRLKHILIDKRPDIFIGVDSPEFNLLLERELREAGIKTVHYVSPSIWAWRSGRVKQVSKSVDKLLALFPFELNFYKGASVDVECVGHPLADLIPLEIDIVSAKHTLNISSDKVVIALMPGSRNKELKRHIIPFLNIAMACHELNKNILFVSNLINSEMRSEMDALVKEHVPNLPIKLYSGRAHDVLRACDVALLASGTITLEAMLFKKPMVVGYILSPITYHIIRMLLSTRWIALPNILAQERLVPEFYQNEVRPEKITPAIIKLLENRSHKECLIRQFLKMHQSLKLDANHRAADAVLRLCG